MQNLLVKLESKGVPTVLISCPSAENSASSVSLSSDIFDTNNSSAGGGCNLDESDDNETDSHSFLQLLTQRILEPIVKRLENGASIWKNKLRNGDVMHDPIDWNWFLTNEALIDQQYRTSSCMHLDHAILHHNYAVHLNQSYHLTKGNEGVVVQILGHVESKLGNVKQDEPRLDSSTEQLFNIPLFVKGKLGYGGGGMSCND